MVTKEEMLAIAAEVLAHSHADETQVIVEAEEMYLTRFAENRIHQNVGNDMVRVNIEVALGKRLGFASTNRTTSEGLKATVDAATAMARLQPETQDYQGLPDPVEVRDIPAYSPNTAAYTPEMRAAVVAQIIKEATAAGFRAAGALTTGVQGLALANSHGVRCAHVGTTASIQTVVMSDEGAGFGAASGQDAAQVDFLAAGRRAIDICRRNKGLRNIEPGEYEVILSADAVADMLGTMGYMAFNGLAVTEGRSMLSGHIGEKLFGENIDIWDDGLTPAGFPLPFDFEGSPRQKLHLVDHGVVKDIPFDRTTAARAGTSTTGHALPPPNSFGPIPLHLAMNGGPATMEEMIRSTKKGLLVTRFHYTNIVHPGKGIWTGMTRDGTFYIEDGQVKYPVRNLRFTQSMGQALNHVDMLGRTVLVGGELGSIVAPPAKIAGWNFTGATEH